MSDTTSNPDDDTTGVDQDTEPSLNAPGHAGPTGIEDGEGGTPGRDPVDPAADRDADQDAEPTQHAPEE